MAFNFRTNSASLVLLFITLPLTGCLDKHGAANSTAQAGGASNNNGADNLTLSGSPPASTVVGTAYHFQPSAADSAGHSLVFSIRNKPVWTNFDTASGTLSGTPAAANAGQYEQVTISVSNGTTTASLAPFSINVTQSDAHTVELTWMPPVVNTNGTTITDLTGFRIYYGSAPTALNHVITVGNAVTSYVFSGLALGTWYFAVAAFNAEKVESGLSAIIPIEL